MPLANRDYVLAVMTRSPATPESPPRRNEGRARDLLAKPAFAPLDDERRAVPAVEFRDVHFAFGGRKVLDGLSFKVAKGEMKIVLGSSGVGKSTLLKLTLGLVKPDEGRVLIDGEDITEYAEEELDRVREKIGMSFQEGALFDSLSVYDNVAYRLHEQGVAEEEVEQEVRRLLRFVGLEDAIDDLPETLSGGMRVRVGIARALAGGPRILLFDEPTAELDPPTARHICELAIRLRDLRGVSSIFVTHEIERLRLLATTYVSVDEAGETALAKAGERLCLTNTKVLMLRGGRLIFSGAAEELFRSNDHFIGEFVRGD